MFYYVHLAAMADKPSPPVAELVGIDADSPEQAVRLLVESGRVLQDRLVAWARVVVSWHEDGRPCHVVRVPLVKTVEVPIESVDWRTNW